MPYRPGSQVRFAMLCSAVLALVCGVEWFPLTFDALPASETVAGLWFVCMGVCVAFLMRQPVDSHNPLLGGLLGFMISFPLAAFLLCLQVLARRPLEGDMQGFVFSLATAAAAALLPLMIDGVRSHMAEDLEVYPRLITWGVLALGLTGLYRLLLSGVVPALQAIAQNLQDNELTGTVAWTLAMITVVAWDRSENYTSDDGQSSILSTFKLTAPELSLPTPPGLPLAPAPGLSLTLPEVSDERGSAMRRPFDDAPEPVQPDSPTPGAR